MIALWNSVEFRHLNWHPIPKLATSPDQPVVSLCGHLSEIGISATAVERPDGLVLIDGHLRSEIVGDETIPVPIVDLNDDEAIKHPSDLNGVLLAATPGSIVFIDECHELKPEFQTALYLALDIQKIVLSGGIKAVGAPQSIPLADLALLLASTDEHCLLQPLSDAGSSIRPNKVMGVHIPSSSIN